MIERWVAYRQGLGSALTAFYFSSLLNVCFFIFSPIFFNKCQNLLRGIGVSAIDNVNKSRATGRTAVHVLAQVSEIRTISYTEKIDKIL